MATIVIDVKENGAKGDGSTNDTSAINSAIDLTSQFGGVVWIPSGIYMIDAVSCLNLKSNVTILMSKNAIIRAITNDSEQYAIFNIYNVSNVKIFGGIIQGDRLTHTSTTGQWGMGISTDSSDNALIEDVYVKDCWGDGVYIGKLPNYGTAHTASTNIKINRVISDNNRRQGMSIVWGDGVSITDCVFKNTNGTAPESGIVIEPDPSTFANNIKFEHCQFFNNAENGVSIQAANGNISNIHFKSCVAKNNTTDGFGIFNSSSSTSMIGVILDSCQISNNVYGIIINDTVGNTINDLIITNCTILNNSKNGANIQLNNASNYNILQGNVARLGSNANKPYFGLRINIGGSNNIVINNNLYNSGNTNYKDNGTGTLTALTNGNRIS